MNRPQSGIFRRYPVGVDVFIDPQFTVDVSRADVDISPYAAAAGTGDS